MSRFNKPTVSHSGPTSPVTTSVATNRLGQRVGRDVPTGVTHEGGAGWVRDAKSALFVLAVTNMVSQDKFYESAQKSDDRYTSLVRQLAVADPEWTFNLLRWLRSPEGNLRTASIVGAAEFVKGRLDAGQVDGGWNRKVVDAVLQRGDEPGELLGYWSAKYGNGRNFPKPLKRGVADAVRKLYTERAFLRYDSDSKGYRFGDVLELTHPTKLGLPSWQDQLFRHTINARHGHDEVIPESLRAVRARVMLNKMSIDERHEIASAYRDRRDFGHMTVDEVQSTITLAMAGSWEWLISWLGTGNE